MARVAGGRTQRIAAVVLTGRPVTPISRRTWPNGHGGPCRSVARRRNSVRVGADDLATVSGGEGRVHTGPSAGGDLVRPVRVEGHAVGQTGVLIVGPGI